MAVYNAVNLILGFLGILKNPNAPLAYNSRCSLTVTNAVAMCHDSGPDRETACKIFCDGSYKGLYRCTKDQGWEKELPNCVSDMKDYAQWCSVTVKEGTIGCQVQERGEIACNVICKRNQTEFGIEYRCSRYRGWDKKFPHCVADLKEKSPCSMTVRNGTAICQDVGGGEISCNVLCDNKPQGFYRCRQNEGWSKALPECVSEFYEYSRCRLVVKNGTVVCKEVKRGEMECNVLCGGKDQGFYRCSQYTGWNKKLPQCVAYLNAPAEPSFEANACDPAKCSKGCWEDRQLEGKCIDGACKCDNKGSG